MNESAYPDDLDMSQQVKTAETQLTMRKARMVDISQNTGILILALKDIFNNIENVRASLLLLAIYKPYREELFMALIGSGEDIFPSVLICRDLQ